MKIKLQEALDLIESADVVKLLHGDSYVIPNIVTDDIHNEYDNEVIYLSWEDDGPRFAVSVTEFQNKEVERDGHKLTFIDDEGDPFELHLFREVPILV